VYRFYVAGTPDYDILDIQQRKAEGLKEISGEFTRLNLVREARIVTPNFSIEPFFSHYIF